MSDIESKVKGLNERLRSDLGTRPQYAWVRGDELRQVTKDIDANGNDKLEMKELPSGLVAMTCKSRVVYMADVYKHILPAEIFTQSFIMCARMECQISEDLWRKTMPGTPYEKWNYVPVTQSVHGQTHLVYRREPDLETTKLFIQAIRQLKRKIEELKTFKQLEAQSHAEYEAGLAKKRAQAVEIGRDLAPAFGVHTPGEKDGVSFPTVELKQKKQVTN